MYLLGGILTGNGSADGLQVGINGQGDVQIINNFNSTATGDIEFRVGTGPTERMVIIGATGQGNEGFVGINVGTPEARLEVHEADTDVPQLRLTSDTNF